MSNIKERSSKNSTFVQSFEVTLGEASGDLISKRVDLEEIKVGLLATSYFEYYRMYDGLSEQVHKNMQELADLLEPHCSLLYPGVVDTLDKSNDAGLYFKKQEVDVIIIAEGTYSVDYLVHQALLHVPESTPLLLFASQAHSKIDYSGGYAASLLNSGPMGIVQFACSLHKMKKFLPYEVVVGAISDPAVVDDIVAFIKIRKAIRDLKFMNVGLIGHIFRGMYDFQYDKTDLTGKLGPHIMDIDIKHLLTIFHSISAEDDSAKNITKQVEEKYLVSNDINSADIERAARLGAALSRLIDQYKLDGLALLGQHFIEAETHTTPYLGIADILSKDQAIVVTEGDVIGLILSKVMKEISDTTPFFGEWEEIDTGLNAVLLLGHGFIDPRIARKDRAIKLGCACEEWGWEGHAPGIEATLEPGPVTLSMIISHGSEWKILISEGVIPDTPPLEINESTVIIQVKPSVREYFQHIIEMGFPHHVMAVPKHIGRSLELFARQTGMTVCRP